MTVSATQSRKTFAGNGSTTSFGTSPVVFFDSSDLVVYVVVDATGVATTLTETTDYTVTGGDGSTGTVATTGLYGAPATGETLVIVRELPRTQTTDFENNDSNDAEVAEETIDRLTMIAQEIDTAFDRTVRLDDSDVSGADPTLPTPEAGTLLGWNDDGDGLQNYSAGELSAAISVSAFMETVLDDASATAAKQTLLLDKHGADIASATGGGTLNLDTATGDLVDVTGTTTKTAIALAEGVEKTVRFTGALTLTNGASLVLLGGADIVTAAGDYAVFRGYAAGVVRMVGYARASQAPDVDGSFTATLTGVSGTVTVTAKYKIRDGVVTLYVPPLSGTSNATSKTITGAPAAIRPAADTQFAALQTTDNTSTIQLGYVTMASTGVITANPDGAGSNWTNSGTATLGRFTMTYPLA